MRHFISLIILILSLLSIAVSQLRFAKVDEEPKEAFDSTKQGEMLLHPPMKKVYHSRRAHGHHQGEKERKHSSASKGGASKHDKTSANSGEDTETNKSSNYDEKSGKKHTVHDESEHTQHYSDANQRRLAAKQADVKVAKKTNVMKGYRQQYHKHEHKNHDSFYNNGEKKGGYHKFGSGHSKKNSALFRKLGKQSNGENGASKTYANKKTYSVENPNGAAIVQKRHTAGPKPRIK